MVYINLKAVLKQNNRSKYWLIKHTELSFQTISNLANNETSGIKFDTLEKICKALDCTPNDIIQFK